MTFRITIMISVFIIIIMTFYVVMTFICHDRDSLARHDDYHGGCQGVLVVMTITKNSAATTNIVMSVMEFQFSCDDRDKFCSHGEYHGGCYGVSIVMTIMANFAVVMNIMVNVVMAFRLS